MTRCDVEDQKYAVNLCVKGECAAEIERLNAEVMRLRNALHEVVFAARTKISMKNTARKALFPTTEGDNHDCPDPPDQQ